MRKNLFCLYTAVLLSAPLSASDCFNSEISHAIGGAVMAGGITAIADQFPQYREDRAMWGFGISSAVVVAYQISEYIDHGNAGGQMLDAAAHIAGSAIGAYVTDEYILSPVIQNSASEGKYIGLAFQRTF